MSHDNYSDLTINTVSNVGLGLRVGTTWVYCQQAWARSLITRALHMRNLLVTTDYIEIAGLVMKWLNNYVIELKGLIPFKIAVTVSV